MEFHESGINKGSPKLRENLSSSDRTVLAHAKHYTGTRNERIKKFVREYYPTYAAWYDDHDWIRCDITRDHLRYYEKIVKLDKQVGKKPGTVKGSRQRSDTDRAQRVKTDLDKLRVFCKKFKEENFRLLRSDIQKEFNWNKSTICKKMKEHVLKEEKII